jgi:hypothetical protein
LRLLETPQGPTPLWSVPAANLPLASAHPNKAVKIAETGAIYVSTLVGGYWTWIAGAGALSQAEMAGLAYSSAGGSTSFTISAGRCADDTGSVMLVLAASRTKTAAPFAAGAGGGGLDTGSMITGTGAWYHTFLIGKADGTTDILFSLSATAPTMPGGFVYKRRIMCVAFMSTNTWIKMWQDGDTFLFDSHFTSVNNVTMTAETRQGFALAVPPGILVEAIINAMIHHPSLAVYVRIDNPSVADASTASGHHQLIMQVAGSYVSTQLRVRTNAAQQVTAKMTNGNGQIWINVIGYVDRRGRDG